MSGGKRSSSATRVYLTERALRDLRGIEQYSIEQWGRKVAERYLDRIAAALDGIRSIPGILRLEPEFAAGMYFYRVEKHMLVCDFDLRNVIVATIVHTSMDIPMRLEELEPRLSTEVAVLRNRIQRLSNS